METEPDYEKITNELFLLEPGEKVDNIWQLECDLDRLDSTLGRLSQIVHREFQVPDEVVHFFEGLYEYVEKNRIK